LTVELTPICGDLHLASPAVEQFLAGPGRQNINRTNDVPAVSKKEVLGWFDLGKLSSDQRYDVGDYQSSMGESEKSPR
jgi:hypothetical protein